MFATDRKKSALLAFAGLLTGAFMLTACAASARSSAAPILPLEPQSVNEKISARAAKASGRFAQSYSSNPVRYMAARSYASEWGSATTIEGNTAQEICDNKILYLESVYEQEQQPFIVIEGISPQEITDFEGVRYMYEKSAVYRELVSTGDTVPIVPQSSYGLVTDDNNPQYHRYVVAADKASELKLKAEYLAVEGRLGFAVVASDGDILFKVDPVREYRDSITLPIDEGLCGIVLIYEPQEQCFKGDISIELTVK